MKYRVSLETCRPVDKGGDLNMASGDTLLIFHPMNYEPPSSGYATPDNRNGRPCLDFDGITQECASPLAIFKSPQSQVQL
jgi:hypothetical protein